MIVELCSTTDVRDVSNKTPLHYACMGGSKDLVQYLVELKMDVGEIYSVLFGYLCISFPCFSKTKSLLT